MKLTLAVWVKYGGVARQQQLFGRLGRALCVKIDKNTVLCTSSYAKYVCRTKNIQNQFELVERYIID